jgi:hypothetical protein
VIRQPSLFIAGARDDVLRFPGMEANLQQLAAVLPGLRGSHILPGAGHWIQRERAAAVNALLIEFLCGLNIGEAEIRKERVTLRSLHAGGSGRPGLAGRPGHPQSAR